MANIRLEINGMYKNILCYLFMLFSTSLFAQNIENYVAHKEPVTASTMLSIGSIQLKDTYLSPLLYNGIACGITEEMSKTFTHNPKLMWLQNIYLNLAISHNPSQTASVLSGDIGYNYALLYKVYEPLTQLQLYIGGVADANVGFIYNTRNGNNPATAKPHLWIGPKILCNYTTPKLLGVPFTIRYQISAPIFALFMAPNYGESYYEIFELGNTKDIVKVGSLHNFTDISNRITIDAPLPWVTLRVGYQYNYRWEMGNSLSTHWNQHSFMIGISRRFIMQKW